MAKNHKQEPTPKKERWYYKHKATGKAAYCLKEPLANILPEEELDNYEEIEKEEWDALTYVTPHVPSEAELHQQEIKRQIAHLKGELAKTDYVVIKIAEAVTEEEKAAIREEYAQVIANRIEWRAEINRLEGELE